MSYSHVGRSVKDAVLKNQAQSLITILITVCQVQLRYGEHATFVFNAKPSIICNGSQKQKRNEAQTACAEATNKGVNKRYKVVTQTQQQRGQPPTVTLTWHASICKVT